MKRLAMLVLLVAPAALAETLYVDADSVDSSPDGTTWASAFPTIQAALAAASGADEVWVAGGTYDGPVTIPNAVHLFGGFAGFETERAERDFAVFRTYIDGNGTGPCVIAGTNSSLDGFVVMNGDTGPTGNGSGVQVVNKTNVQVRNTVFTGNAGGFGAAAYAGLGSMSLTNCVFVDNEASYGPVVYGLFANITMVNCSAFGNTTIEFAGGVHLASSSITAENCIFWQNGSVDVSLTSVRAGVDSGLLTNCLVREVLGQVPAYSKIDCLVNVDPHFFNPALFDLRLLPGSPAIDAALDFDDPDIRNVARPQGLGTDIGAYEFLENDPTDSDSDGISDLDEGATDSDGDETPDYLDTDSDDNGVLDADEGAGDTDGDGVPDYLDDDNDGNGISDSAEGTADTDGDGVLDVSDPDNDGDGILDYVEGILDFDSDGVPNLNDLDSDDDGISDSAEGVGDPDGDGIPNFLDLDSNENGIADGEDGTGDDDGDGLPAFVDDDDSEPFVSSDVNGDGQIDAVDIQLVINLALGVGRR